MKPVWGLDHVVLPFVNAVAGTTLERGTCLAVVRGDGEMVAGVVFHDWNEGAGVVQVSAASIDPRWASRSVLREGFRYAFDFLGAQMAVAHTHEENTRVRRLWRAMGAKEYLIPRLRGRMASEAILCLADDAWLQSKFMRSSNGQTVPAAAA